MKVLMVNHPDCLRFRGGDMVVLRKLAGALRARGIEVAECIEAEPDPAGYDVAHVFNTNPPQAILRQVRSLERHGVPVVATTIYHPVSFLWWAEACIRAIFSSPRPEAEIEQALESLRLRQLQLSHRDGRSTISVGGTPQSAEYVETQREILRHVDHLLPGSYLEMAEVMRTLRVADKPFTVVPFGIDAAEFCGADPGPFAAKYGVRDFVLQVSRFDGLKNQLLLLRALAATQLPIVLVGELMDPAYGELCRAQASERVTILPYLPPEELRGAYAAARVHVLPSFMETCGLVTMEAALADCNVVASCTGNEVEYFRDLAYYCDPVDVGSIRSAVIRAYDNYADDAGRRERLRKLIVRKYSWPAAAEAVAVVYEGLSGGD